MYRFDDVIGQTEAARQLKREADEGRVPHALLLTGPAGAGKLALALALARRLCCAAPTPDGEACGRCASCRQWEVLGHPDAHFLFPIPSVKATCDDYLPQWRQLLARTGGYAALPEWNRLTGAGPGAQPQIYAAEADRTLHKLSLRAASAEGWRPVVVWLPERMNEACANKLLKLLEEPPARTVFILVSQEPERLLPTVVSRTRQLRLRPVPPEARRQPSHPDLAEAALELFKRLARLAWMRDIRGMKAWSEELAAMGREAQKDFLEYAQHMVRENFAANFGRPELTGMTADESNFAQRFAPYVNERNVLPLTCLLERAQEHVAQNVNPRMVFFDLILQMTVLIRMKN